MNVRISLAAAMTLGLRHGSFYRGARLHCLNMLLDYSEVCYASCTYCGLSGNRDDELEKRSFIRVEWPSFSVDEVISRSLESGSVFQRACISMVMHPRAFHDTMSILDKLNSEIELPVSILVNPSSIPDGGLDALDDAGADMVTVAIDAATEELFDGHRGRKAGGPHDWDQYWKVLSDSAMVFGSGRFGCHLIVGLGETELEMAATVQRVRDMGGMTHLFSFYPEEGSELEDREPCHASQFRRVQLARFLIDYDIARVDDMEVDEMQRLTGFGLPDADLDEIVDSGDPFRTSGCPGSEEHSACNRPYGDGPASDIRSFPFRLEAEDIALVRKQLAIYREFGQAAGATRKISAEN